MTNSTIGRNTSTNGSGAFLPVNDTDIFSDLESLRLSPDEAGQVGTEEVLVHVSVRRPTVNEFVRTNPDPAMQVSQVGNAAWVEREAVTLPLDHAFGFELADVTPAAIEMQR
jgi:hypothetical protein